MTATRAEQERAVLTAATAMVDALLHANNPELVRTIAEAAFPWASHLSDMEAGDFIEELITSVRAGLSLDNPAPAARTIEMWRHTAEVHADPELARVLSTPTEGDFGSVPVSELSAPHRGKRIAAPASGSLGELRFAASEAVHGWDELCRQAPANTLVAYEEKRRREIEQAPTTRHHRLKGTLATGMHNGIDMEQWQVLTSRSTAHVRVLHSPQANTVEESSNPVD